MAHLVTPEDLREALRCRAVLELGVDYAYAFRIEPDGAMVCEWASEGFQQLTGYTPEALLALGGYDRLIHPEDLAISQRRTAAALRGETVSDYLRIITRGGEVRWIKDVLRPELDAEGRVTRLYGVARDVTERRQAVMALQETRQMLESIIANSQDGVVLYDEEGRIVIWNAAMERITGLPAEAVQGSSVAEVVRRLRTGVVGLDGIESESKALVDWVRTGEAPWLGQLLEGQIVCPDGTQRTVQASSFQMCTAQGRRVGHIVRDVTERSEMLRALGEAQLMLENILNRSQDGIVILDERGCITTWSPAMEAMTGLDAKQIQGASFMDVLRLLQTELVAEDVTEPRNEHLRRWLDTGEAPWAGRLVEGRITSLGGDRRVVQASSLRWQTPAGWRSGFIMRDTTTQAVILQALRESEQRLRDLASRTGAALEEERAHMAREIHDGLGQTLTAIQFDLHWLTRRLRRAAPEVRAKLQSMVAELDEAIGSVQELARALRPHLLDELGLAATVEWQLQRFTARYGVAHTLHIEPDEPAVEREIATTLFRILQEALTNVARHAQATAVEVILTQDADGARLTVRDNGRGITSEEAASPNALGLIGMDERAARCGGSVDIVGRAGFGTTVSVFIPCKGGKDDTRIRGR